MIIWFEPQWYENRIRRNLQTLKRNTLSSESKALNSARCSCRVWGLGFRRFKAVLSKGKRPKTKSKLAIWGLWQCWPSNKDIHITLKTKKYFPPSQSSPVGQRTSVQAALHQALSLLLILSLWPWTLNFRDFCRRLTGFDFSSGGVCGERTPKP